MSDTLGGSGGAGGRSGEEAGGGGVATAAPITRLVVGAVWLGDCGGLAWRAGLQGGSGSKSTRADVFFTVRGLGGGVQRACRRVGLRGGLAGRRVGVRPLDRWRLAAVLGDFAALAAALSSAAARLRSFTAACFLRCLSSSFCGEPGRGRSAGAGERCCGCCCWRCFGGGCCCCRCCRCFFWLSRGSCCCVLCIFRGGCG